MPITPDQRTTALTLLVNNFGNDDVLNTYIPGLTSAGFIQALVGSIGTVFDDALTQCLSVLVSQTQQNIVSTQAGIADMQKQIQEDTVTP